MNKVKNICIFTRYSTDICYSPTLYYLIKYLLLDNVEVTLFYNGNIGSFELVSHPKLIVINTTNPTRSWIKKLGNIFCYIKYLIFLHYDHHIFVDEDGLLFSILRSISVKSTNILLSLDIKILPSNEVQGIKKKIITLLIKRVRLTIIQDSLRYKLLQSYYNLDTNGNVFFLPNTYETFNNDTIKHLCSKEIIYSGACDDWTILDDDFLEFIKCIPNDWKLYLHLRFNVNNYKIQDYLKRFLKFRDKVIITSSTLTPDEYDNMIDSRAIGLVWVNKHSEDINALTIGLSSGKLFQYLRHGKPIMTNARISIGNAGTTFIKYVEDYSSLPSLLKSIDSNYEKLSSDALLFFNENFTFEKYYQELIGKLYQKI